ncbi:MAG: DUF1302 domain-containing protein [Endozoicomonas sp.]
MQNKKITPRLSALALAVAGALAAQNAQALSFDLSNEATLDWDTTIAYTAAWRMSGQNSDLIDGSSNINFDDGNRNFKKGAMINNRLSVLTEMDLRYRDMGFFARGSAFYDDAYFGENDNDSQATVNSLSAPAGRFTDGTKDTNGKDARLLDAFIYGNFEIGERNLSVRVGQQVVQWGEGLFLPGISSGQGPANGTKANIPGVEVKDIYLPVGQIYAEFDITDNLSIGAYSQWEWKKTEIDGSGAYFSTADMLDEGGEMMNLLDLQQAGATQAAINGLNANKANVVNGAYFQATGGPAPANVLAALPNANNPNPTRGKDISPSDSGQWGVAFNYFAENIGEGVDFGLYYLNYHEKEPKIIEFYNIGGYDAFDDIGNPLVDGALNNPLLVANFAQLPSNYRLNYFENIKLIGASFSTNIGETNIAGEIHQKKGATVISSNNGLAVRADTMQVQLSMLHSLGVTPIADNIMLTGEIGYNEVTNLDDDELMMEKSGSGMAGRVMFAYNNVFPATNLEVPVSFRKNFEGHSAAGTFIPQRGDSLSVGANFTYKTSLQAGISYSAYFGSAEDNKLTDRDFVSLNLKYSF